MASLADMLASLAQGQGGYGVQGLMTPVGDVIPFGKKGLYPSLGTEGAFGRERSGGPKVGTPEWTRAYEQQSGLRPGTMQPVERESVLPQSRWDQAQTAKYAQSERQMMDWYRNRGPLSSDPAAGIDAKSRAAWKAAKFNELSSKQVEQGIRNRTFSKAQIQDFLNNPVYQRTVAEAFSKLTPAERAAWARIMQ